MSHKNNKIKSFISDNYTHGGTGKKKLHVCKPWKHITAMPPITPHFTYASHGHTTHNKRSQTHYLWQTCHHPGHATLRQTFLTMPPMTNHVFRPNITLTNPNSHCALATITNYLFTQATHDKPFYLCHPWQTISTITHIKKKKEKH